MTITSVEQSWMLTSAKIFFYFDILTWPASSNLKSLLIFSTLKLIYWLDFTSIGFILIVLWFVLKTKKIINYWSKSTLISVMFWIFSMIKYFLPSYFISSRYYRQIIKISISHVMQIARFVQFGLINILWISCFYILFLLLVNGIQTLCVNPGCLKCISGMNISLAKKSCLLF